MSHPGTVLFFLRRVGPYHHARFQAAAKKLNLIVVETRPTSAEYPWEFEAKGDYHKYSFPTSENPELGLRGNLLKNEIDQLFQTHQPSVVVTTGWADPEYHAVVLQAIKRRIPRVVVSDSRFEDEPRIFFKEWIKKKILKSYSAALVAGGASESYLANLGFSSSAIFKPWDVVDNDYFLKLIDEQEIIAYHEKYFFCVARFIAKKNVSGLLKGFAHYKQHGGKRSLLIAGSGEEKNEIVRLIDLLQLSSYVTLVGFIQYQLLPHYFSRAFCLILPSHTDQWGLVVNEAMACKLPVLVSIRCGCAQDLVVEGKNGFLFDPKNPENITEALCKIDQFDSAQWNEMSNQSASLISEWNTNSFALGLYHACVHAIQEKEEKTIFRGIHYLLSR
jgi:glycosyltransferase involved in cell wall biosynthesis